MKTNFAEERLSNNGGNVTAFSREKAPIGIRCEVPPAASEFFDILKLLIRGHPNMQTMLKIS